jgi:hypothetical protein
MLHADALINNIDVATAPDKFVYIKLSILAPLANAPKSKKA